MQKNEIQKTILAVRPGRREMGVAVLEGDDLLFWGVAGFRSVSEEGLRYAVRRKLESLILIYQPQVIASEKPSHIRLKASQMLGDVAAQVSIVALEMSLEHCIVDPKNVRLRLCGSRKTSRRAMAEYVISLYPHLGRYHRCMSRWQQSYWMPMFTAVAVGLVCSADNRF